MTTANRSKPAHTCLVNRQATMLAFFLGILWANVTAKACAVDSNVTLKNFASVDFLRYCFEQLVRKNEGRLVLAVQIAGKLHHRLAIETSGSHPVDEGLAS